jgi:hypothetical protein
MCGSRFRRLFIFFCIPGTRIRPAAPPPVVQDQVQGICTTRQRREGDDENYRQVRRSWEHEKEDEDERDLNKKKVQQV